MEQARLDYAYNRTAGGLILDKHFRRLLRRAMLAGELTEHTRRVHAGGRRRAAARGWRCRIPTACWPACPTSWSGSPLLP